MSLDTEISPVKVACIQINSGNDIAENIRVVSELIRKAAGAGARFIATPEYTGLYGQDEHLMGQTFFTQEHPMVLAMQQLASNLGVEILLGSTAVKAETTPGKLHNRSFLISPEGQIIATYNKIHLFDVNVPGVMTYRESDTLVAGNEMVVANSSAFMPHKIGMTICYDVRNPTLYRNLAQAGAEVIAVPAAFTKYTGELGHWETLLKARAVETGSIVIAPNQTGKHPGWKRETYGNSMIIDPSGKVLARAGTEIGFISAEVDLEQVRRFREIIPAWQNDPPYHGGSRTR